MTTTTLNIAQVSNRGNKFAIVAGNATLRKFKTVEEAQKELNKNRSFYEYWAGSVSVAVDNSKKVFVVIS